MVPSDIALLVGGPILVSILVFEANREQFKLNVERRALLRFPLALVLSTAACLGTSLLYAKVNPYVIYSYPNAVFFSLFALGFVVLSLVLAGAAWWMPSSHQTTTILAESLIMWWIIIIIDIKGLLATRAFFFTPFLYMSSLIALSAMLLQTIRPQEQSLPGTVRLPEGNEDDEAQENENTASVFIRGHDHIVKSIRTWDLRKVAIVGVTLGTQLGLLIVLMVMKNNWIQYQQPRAIMLVDAASALFLVLPFATFMHKLHWSVPTTFSLVFIGTFFFSLFIFPFTDYSPAYLEFSQTVSLDNGTNLVQVAGPRGYTEDIVAEFPSFMSSALRVCAESPMGLAGQPESSFCKWHGLATPEPPIYLLTVEQYHQIFHQHVIVRVIYAQGCTGYGLEFTGSSKPRWEGLSRTEEASGNVTETFKVSVKEALYIAKVSCVWHGLEKRQVPAFAEAETSSPSWVSIRDDPKGLVVVERHIHIHSRQIHS